MKRTKQTFFRDFPSEAQNHEISGCREFQGEDLKYQARREFFKNKQRQWLDQQIEEKRQREEQEKLEEQLYATQTLELNRMRGMLEDNFLRTKSNLLAKTTEINLQLDLQRKQREQAERRKKLQYQRQQVEYLKQRGAKQDFYMDIK